MKYASIISASLALFGSKCEGFAPNRPHSSATFSSKSAGNSILREQQQQARLNLAPPDSTNLDTIALVAGQEVYGFGIVALGEGIWSFAQLPSFDNAKVLVPALLAAVVCFAVSGPAVTSGEFATVGFGLEVATAVSVLMGLSYVARMLAQYSPSPKEVAFLGLLVSLAGFFSFSQNLIVDGFITLPTIDLPFDLPSLPHVDYGDLADQEGF